MVIVAAGFAGFRISIAVAVGGQAGSLTADHEAQRAKLLPVGRNMSFNPLAVELGGRRPA